MKNKNKQTLFNRRDRKKHVAIEKLFSILDDWILVIMHSKTILQSDVYTSGLSFLVYKI